MNTQINRIRFKQTLGYIVLIFACFPAFGSPAEWRGGYSDEWYQEGSKRFLPSPVEWRGRYIDEFYSDEYRGRYSDEYSEWIRDLEQPFDFGSAWVLYNASQDIWKYKPERDLLSLYFSPRWRHVDTVILQEPEIEVWQIPADTGRRFRYW